MITTLRRLFGSTIGKTVALIFLVMIAFAFAASDISGGAGFGGVGGANVAQVGDTQIGVGELRSRARRAYDQAREQQPGLTMAAFVESGGVDDALKAMVEAVAFRQYAAELGFGTSKRQIDGRIADLPVFFGLTGKFDQAAYDRFLTTNGVTDREVREDIERQLLLEQLVAPIGALPGLSPAVAQPYAALLLEQRRGLATFIPASSFAPTTSPDDKVLAAYLAQNRSKYSLPERRVLRYAIFDRSAVTAEAPNDAEIAAAFKANAARYLASETRQFAQVIAPTQAIAATIANKARTGSTLDAAAKASGLAASMTPAIGQKQFASQSNAAMAKAGFDAARGSVVGPLQSPLGWAVLRVEAVNATPAKTLAQATPEIRDRLAADKANEAMVDFYNAVQDAVNAGASLDEIAADRKLKLVETPPILPSGRAPEQAGFAMPAVLAPMVQQAFLGGSEGEGQLATLIENEAFAVYDIKQILPSAPPPMAKLRDQLVNDWRLAQGQKLARDKARALVKAVESGKPLAEAVRSAGPNVGSVQTIGGRRADLAQGGTRVPPEVALLFSMAAGSVKTLEIPGNRGWMVIALGAVDRPDPAKVEPARVAAVLGPLAGAIGNELVAQMVADARLRVGVETNQPLVDQLKRELSGAVSPAE